MRFCLTALMIFTLAACASVSKEDKERSALHMDLGTGLLAKGQYPQAMSELLKADSLDPHNPLVLNNLGIAYYVRQRPKQAEEKFREAIKIAPKFSDAKNNLARVLLDRRRFNEAIKLLDEVEGDLTYLYPEKTLSTKGMAYFEQGQFSRAETYLARSLEIRRDNCATANYYGRTLYELKKVKQSARVLDQAIDFCRSSHFEDPIYYSAMSYFSLGEKEKTRARLDELLKEYPQSKYVAQAKGMLELLEQ
jgi:Tfp pilus assembly protein PilF